MMMMMTTRVDIVTGVEFDEFLTAFEAAAPAFDPVPMQRIVESGGTWDEVRTAVARNAPNELMVYAKIDAAPLLGVAGHDVKAVEYLLGNHVIAETMFRHDPKALLYAPLRLLVYGDADGNAVFSMDRPSWGWRPRHRRGHRGGFESGPKGGQPVAGQRGRLGRGVRGLKELAGNESGQ